MGTIHPIVCYAICIVEETTGKAFVFTSDSGYSESFTDSAKDADLFLVDTYLLKGNEHHHAHFISKEAGELARSANVKKLVLTYLPQFGDLEQLKSEAQKAAGRGIDIELVTADKVFNI